MGIDIGTYQAKGVVTDQAGSVLTTAATDLELEIPRQGRAEHDAERTWWGGFSNVSRQLLSRAKDEHGDDAGDVEALGISTIGPAVVPVDGAGNPLRKAILYGVDTRASQEIEQLNRRIGEETIFRTCGHQLSSQSAGPKILWIKNNEPEVYERSHRFLAGTSYLQQKLTGRCVLDYYTAAAYSPMFDINQRQWSPELLPHVTEREKLPDLAWSHQIVGEVHPEAAEQTGLEPGTRVIAGTADALSESISVGAVDPGELMIMYGSSTFFIHVVDERPESRDLWPSLHAVPDLNTVTGGTATAGSITRWFFDQWVDSSGEEMDVDEGYTRLTDRARESPPGANGLITLPYFSGERTPLNDPRARGSFFGLTLKHTLGDLYRSILEGIGYSIRHNIEAMESIGVSPEVIVAVGGGTKSDVWLQSVSDIGRIRQKVPEVRVGASYGDAFLAGLGSGRFDELNQVNEWVSYEEVITPRQQYAKRYEQYYELYRGLYGKTRQTMHELSLVEQGGEPDE